MSYYNIILTNENELDFEAMGVSIKSVCSICGREEYNKPTWKFGKAIVKQNNWVDYDLFVLKHFEYNNYGSLKTLEIIDNNKFTNFRFKDFEKMFDYMAEDTKIKDIINKEK